jgi:hypothetical protein
MYLQRQVAVRTAACIQEVTKGKFKPSISARQRRRSAGAPTTGSNSSKMAHIPGRFGQEPETPRARPDVDCHNQTKEYRLFFMTDESTENFFDHPGKRMTAGTPIRTNGANHFTAIRMQGQADLHGGGADHARRNSDGDDWAR